MKLKIVTPERVVLEADSIDAVYAKAVDGELGILPKHVPLVTPLAIGVLSYVQQGRKQPAAVMGGILSTDGQNVTILSNAAELNSEIDMARAEQAKQRAEAQLREKHEHFDQAHAQEALARASVRIKVRG